MEDGDPGERAPVERDTPDELRVTSLNDTPPNGRYAGRSWRWGLRLGGLVALLGLIAVAAVALSPLIPRPAARKAPPLDITALQIPPEARSCIVAGAWSPDGAQVAIVRDSVCDASSTQSSPNVMIFNGKTGDLVSVFALDAAILRTSAQGSLPALKRVDMERVVWSSNSVQVALPFIVAPLAGAGPVTLGLALLAVRNARGAHIGAMQLWTDTVHDFTPPDLLAQSRPHTIMSGTHSREASAR